MRAIPVLLLIGCGSPVQHDVPKEPVTAPVQQAAPPSLKHKLLDTFQAAVKSAEETRTVKFPPPIDEGYIFEEGKGQYVVQGWSTFHPETTVRWHWVSIEDRGGRFVATHVERLAMPSRLSGKRF